MSPGKYLSLEEARRKGLLARFAKQHPSEGDEALFDRLMQAMAHGEPPERKAKSSTATGRTSPRASRAC
jgi:hypothetical protein